MVSQHLKVNYFITMIGIKALLKQYQREIIQKPSLHP